MAGGDVIPFLTDSASVETLAPMGLVTAAIVAVWRRMIVLEDRGRLDRAEGVQALRDAAELMREMQFVLREQSTAINKIDKKLADVLDLVSVLESRQ